MSYIHTQGFCGKKTRPGVKIMKTEDEIKKELNRLYKVRDEREGLGIDYHTITSAILKLEWVLELA